MTNKRNLPDLFNGLYDNCIAQKISPSEFQFISAILFKFNAKFFPNTLEISNTELRGLANLSASSFCRARQMFLRRKSPEGQVYLTYISSDRQDKAGTYSIQYDVMRLQRVCNEPAIENPENQKTIADPLQSDPEFGHDPNITKQTNDLPPQYREIVKVVSNEIGTYWNPTKEEEIKALKAISVYSIEDIQEHIGKARKKDKRMQPATILNFTKTCIDRKLKDAPIATSAPKQELTGEMAMKEQAFHEARAWHSQHSDGVWKEYNMPMVSILGYCDTAIAHFDKYGQELIDFVGYDKSYWEAVRNSIKGGVK